MALLSAGDGAMYDVGRAAPRRCWMRREGGGVVHSLSGVYTAAMPQARVMAVFDDRGEAAAKRQTRRSRRLEVEVWARAIAAIGDLGLARDADDGVKLRSEKGQDVNATMWEAAMGVVFEHALQRVAATRGVRWPSGLRTGDAPDRSRMEMGRRLRNAAETSNVLASLPAVDSAKHVGWLYERMLAFSPRVKRSGSTLRFELHSGRSSRRRTQGSFYTPESLVRHVLNEALEPVMDRAVEPLCGEAAERALLELRVCDPSCGTGNFLLAAAERIAARLCALRRARGANDDSARARREVIGACVHGVDLDALAVRLCRTILAIESGDASCLEVLESHIRCGDALLGARWNAESWCAAMCGGDVTRRGGFDVVIGNPPFLNQLESDTAAAREAAAILRERSGGAVRGYADMASAFLLLATEIARPGGAGMIALVQPHSLLAARDAAAVRGAILDGCTLRSLWVANERVFEASVQTCAPALQRDGPRCVSVDRWHGADFKRLSSIELNMDVLSREERGWAHLVAEAMNIPSVTCDCAMTIGDVAAVTADFRDQYYGLDGFIVENDDLSPAQREDWAGFPPLITTGLIDLADNGWGERSTRVLKRIWHAPRIDRARMEREGDLGAWLAARLVPKILLATQTRVIELVVDDAGRFVPAVPLLTIVPRAARDIWRIAAALASPACTAIALRTYSGTAMSADAIKLAARQAAALPMPALSPALEHAADELQRASAAGIAPNLRREALDAMGRATLEAFGVPDAQRESLTRWWCERRVRRIAAPSESSAKLRRASPVQEV